MKLKLEPCPFCGGKAEFCEDEDRSFVECTECNASSVAMRPEKCDVRDLLAERWNFRLREYVPGEWVCDACGFVLVKSTINPASGKVGRSSSNQSEACPNDGMAMRRVLLIDSCRKARDMAMKLARETSDLTAAVKDLRMLSVRAIRAAKHDSDKEAELIGHVQRIAGKVGVQPEILREYTEEQKIRFAHAQRQSKDEE